MTEFTLRKLQDEIRPWQQHNFPDSPSWQSYIGISEETGELGHAFLKSAQDIRGTAEEHRAAMVDAVADIIVYIADFCNKENIDLQQAVETTWAQVKTRRWRRTAYEWLSEPKYVGTTVLKPDGWEPDGWGENITEQEFLRRLSISVCVLPHAVMELVYPPKGD